MSFYHVYNRGCNRELLFAQPDNYIYLLRKIKTHLPEHPIGILAYCLMPNHYHFLLEAEAVADISVFIQRIFNGYVQAFNKQQHRRVTLFEGRVKIIVVDSESYVLQLCRYIHLNPVNAKLVANPEDWPYSNYQEWIGQRQGALKDEAFIREYFPTPEDYCCFVSDYQDEQHALEKLEKYICD
jgi:putative transposase